MHKIFNDKTLNFIKYINITGVPGILEYFKNILKLSMIKMKIVFFVNRRFFKKFAICEDSLCNFKVWVKIFKGTWHL